MKGIALVGTGRLAESLARTFAGRIAVVAGRDASRVTTLAGLAGARAASLADVAVADVDLVWIATSDASISSVADAIARGRENWTDVVVVHSAGALDTAPLAPFIARGARALALHPNASVRGDAPMPQRTIWGVTPSDEVSLATARGILGDDGNRLLGIDEAHRTLYHAAATAAANFSVTLFAMAENLYREAGVDGEEAAELVAGFMRTSVLRSHIEGAAAAMTGPIVRGDDAVVAAQLAAVRDLDGEIGAAFEALVMLTRRVLRS